MADDRRNTERLSKESAGCGGVAGEREQRSEPSPDCLLKESIRIHSAHWPMGNIGVCV